MENQEIRKYLVDKIKSEHCLWSYDVESISDLTDDMLIEKTLIYLDLKDIDKLFLILPYKQIRKSWINSVIPLGPRYYSLNRFLAWYYFNAKKPGPYVKSMMTRSMNRLMQ